MEVYKSPYPLTTPPRQVNCSWLWEPGPPRFSHCAAGDFVSSVSTSRPSLPLAILFTIKSSELILEPGTEGPKVRCSELS